MEVLKPSKPEQLILFEFGGEHEERYSNTLELYDALPKYYWGNVPRKDGRFLESLVRDFVHKGQELRLTIDPARIEGKEFYPSQREELVEDALRKLACNGQGLYLEDMQGDQQIGVVFSLYELQKELERMGHGYNINQIKEALLICAKTTIQLESRDGQQMLVSNLFTTLGLQSREDWKKKGKRSKGYVRFNALVTQAVNSLAFRQLDYAQVMKYRKALSRWLHKRISHNFTQAAHNEPYTIKASTILRDSGTKVYERFRDNIRNIETSLQEMIDADVVQSYSKEDCFDPMRRDRVEDAKFQIFMSKKFIGDMILANNRHKLMKSKHLNQGYQPADPSSRLASALSSLGKKFKA